MTKGNNYPFGSTQGGRGANSVDYRFGFNGKENDGEWGTSLVQDYGFRLYNPGIGRFLSVDPLRDKYPMLTPYQFASNTPIIAIDLDGLEGARRATPRTNPILRAAHVRKRAANAVRVIEMVPENIRQERLNAITRTRQLYADGRIDRWELAEIRRARERAFGSDVHLYIEYESRYGEPGNVYMVYQDLARLNRIMDELTNGKVLASDDLNYYNEGLTGEHTTPKETKSGILEFKWGLAEVNKDGGLDMIFDVPEGLKGQGLGKEMFEKALIHFGDRVGYIGGKWLGGGDLKDNFDSFKSAYEQFISRKNETEESAKKKAAFYTFTGRMAKKHGYTDVDVDIVRDDSGEMTSVNAEFRKPNK